MIHVLSGGYSNDPFGRLVGKTVSSLFVSENEQELRFETDDGDVGVWAEGDCCSESWFADITGFDALIGSKVVSVEIVDMPDIEDDRSRQEFDQAYGYKITTEKGICDIVFRNSSNGYYGGWAVPSEAEGATVKITDDWSA
jgi:hypothetical protein